MKYKNKGRHILVLAAVVFSVMSISGIAEAMKFELGADTTLDVDTTLSWAGGWRVKDRDLNNVAMRNVNGNDGGWNFDQWDMINNRVAAIMDIDLQYKNVGVFVRPRAFYDRVYMTDNSNPGPLNHPTNNNYIAGLLGVPGAETEPNAFDSELEDVMGRRAEFLDYFAYANFSLGGRSMDLRAGQQVVAWGEQLYLSGGVASAMSHADLTAANVPGVELKEVYLPSESISFRTDILDNLSMAAFYQWEWEPHRLNESGSYFSDSDVVDEAGHLLIAGPTTFFRRGDDNDAKDDGQYGLGTILRIPTLNETEFGFYYINYHEKSPLVFLTYPTYQLGYAEDVKLYGASFSSFIGSVSLSGEFTYRHDYPLTIRTGVYEDGNVAQAQLAWLYSLGQNPFFDDVSFNGEIGCNKVLGVDGEDMAFSDFAWGYSLALTPKFYQLFPNMDMEIPLVYKGNPAGSSPNKTFVEGADSASIGTTFTWKNIYKVELRYVDYFNASRNSLSDRDFVGVNVKYTF